MQTNQTSPSNISRYNGKIPKNAHLSLRRIIRKQRNSYRRKEDRQALLESLAIIHEETTDRLKKEARDKIFYASDYQQFFCSIGKNGHNHSFEQMLKASLIEIECHSLYLKRFV